ncbi:MAG: pilin [bacterium]|nr:pilin [bacterium]
MKIVHLIIAAAFFVTGFLFFGVTKSVYAQIDEASKDAACEGLSKAGRGCSSTRADRTVEGLVKTVINILSWVVGIAAVIMVIVGGLKYIASNGDSNGISSAKNTIIYALIGLVIAALAQFIVRFVLAKAT